jgi:Type ISP C-terminal specificity domain/N-6 DNA Methylase
VGPFKVTLDTLLRVIGAVDWERVRFSRRDTYLYLYEHFLAEYDPVKRQESGVYYTPVELVEPMVRLTDDALRTRLGLIRGLGTDGVRVVDPAAGTGTFLLRILDTVFEQVNRCDGTGEALKVISSMAGRLVGFELQMGPYAVSELRLTLHVTDTLDDPSRVQPPLASFLKPISESTRRADQIKAVLPVTVVIGNPPYRERANEAGSWVELGGFYGRRGRTEDPSLMSDFRLPGNGRNEYKLKNMAWYFWRWATWKVFDSPSGQGRGVVAFVTTVAYLRGTAFKGMRKYLRRTCDEGWIIDLSPVGMRPDVATRIFPKVQHPLAFDNRGGRVLPGFHPDGQPTSGASLLDALSKRFGVEVSELDLLCYVAAVVSHPGYTARFAEQLETPGVRVPLTADAEIFAGAVELGREVVWASTYGQRCADPAADPAAGRPPDDVSLPPGQRPMNLDGIPHTPEGMPTTIEHTSDDPDARNDDVLLVGASRCRPLCGATTWVASRCCGSISLTAPRQDQ